MTRPKLRASSSQLRGYDPGDSHATTESGTPTVSDDARHENRQTGSRDDPDATQFSDGDSSIDDDANVKLLPLEKPDTLRPKSDRLHYTPSASSSSRPGDDPEEERDVGKRIEQVLETERGNLLAQSFNTDLEDGESLLSEGGSDGYGVSADKTRGKLGVNGGGYGDHNTKSGWRSVFRLRSWWSILLLATAAVLLMWLAAKVLGFSIWGGPAREHVRATRRAHISRT